MRKVANRCPLRFRTARRRGGRGGCRRMRLTFWGWFFGRWLGWVGLLGIGAFAESWV